MKILILTASLVLSLSYQQAAKQESGNNQTQSSPRSAAGHGTSKDDAAGQKVTPTSARTAKTHAADSLAPKMIVTSPRTAVPVQSTAPAQSK